ncbi:calcium-binding protein [Microvirga arabica]|uniref:Calcium-binding protein n=1 Tax=Microvirga arabica TaxID=1128671 RepID=A0ABV6Y456_9HYPH|nr:M10 family metallopeptidase C-terminal domain-containing protein [Microvirga arabica]MBM1169762.1 M10 family metallopeptidase C-terminal domain-containing protein [Microvirga arabica]
MFGELSGSSPSGSDYIITHNNDGSFTIADKRDGEDIDTIRNVEILEFLGGKKVTPSSLFPPSDIRLDGDVVTENTRAGNAVGTLGVTDNMGDIHRFELIDDAQGRFALETVNGITRLMVNDGVRLDYEQSNRHSITVKVTDGANNSITETIAVTVYDALDENATGSAGADLIKGGNGKDTFAGAAGNDTLDAGAGNDRLTGNDGNDRLVGGLGKDTLTGNTGLDVFMFDDRETGTSKSKADYITDFKGREGDRFDLKLVDANTKKSGDQKFSFIGTKAFSKAGEVRYEKTKKETYVYLSTDTDKSAEAVIKLKGAIDLSKAWFVL